MNGARRSALAQAVRAEFKRTFGSLSQRDFLIFSIGNLVSLTGTRIQSEALSWLVFRTTGSATSMALVSLALSGPVLILSYLGGMAADRMDRRRLLIATQIAAAAQSVVLAYYTTVSQAPSIVLLAVLSIFLGIVNSLEQPTRQALLPDLVSKGSETNATSLQSATLNLARIIGPAIAGVTIVLLGEGACFGLNSLTFMVCIASLVMIGRRSIGQSSKKEPQIAAKEATLLSLLKQKTVRRVLASTTVLGLCGFEYVALLPIVTEQLLHGNAVERGWLSSAAGVGALIGSLTIARTRSARSTELAMALAGIATGVAVLLLSVSSLVWMSCFACFLAGIGISVQINAGRALLQMNVPRWMLGRVMGVYTTLLIGVYPFTAVGFGMLIPLLGVQLVLVLSATVTGVSGVIYLVVAKIWSTDSNRSIVEAV